MQQGVSIQGYIQWGHSVVQNSASKMGKLNVYLVAQCLIAPNVPTKAASCATMVRFQQTMERHVPD